MIFGLLPILAAEAQNIQPGDKSLKTAGVSSIDKFVVAQASSERNASAGAADDSEAGIPTWFPSEAIPEKFDWIQLTSGEWLKGDLKVLYKDVLEFDSDELELLKFDWEDIRQIRGFRLHSVMFENPLETVVGKIKMIEDKVIMIVDDRESEFERRRLVSIAHGAPEEISYWSAKITFSLDTRVGNTESINYSTSAYAKRRTSASRFNIEYLGIFNQTDGVETANSQRAGSYYDVFRTRRLYLRPIFAEYFRDPFTNVENRITVGTGFGYQIINTPKTDWEVTPAIAYQYTQNVSVEAGEDEYTSTPALVLGTEYDTEITRKIDFNGVYQAYIVNEASGTYLHHAVATLEFEITDELDFDVSFVWDRIQAPTAAADGTEPKQDDFYLFIGIGFEL
jgi:putative salt-induced outer membrane protein YdiY